HVATFTIGSRADRAITLAPRLMSHKSMTSRHAHAGTALRGRRQVGRDAFQKRVVGHESRPDAVRLVVSQRRTPVPGRRRASRRARQSRDPCCWASIRCPVPHSRLPWRRTRARGAARTRRRTQPSAPRQLPRLAPARHCLPRKLHKSRHTKFALLQIVRKSALQRLLPSWPWAQGVAGSNPVARPFFSQILTAY